MSEPQLLLYLDLQPPTSPRSPLSPRTPGGDKLPAIARQGRYFADRPVTIFGRASRTVNMVAAGPKQPISRRALDSGIGRGPVQRSVWATDGTLGGRNGQVQTSRGTSCQVRRARDTRLGATKKNERMCLEFISYMQESPIGLSYRILSSPPGGASRSKPVCCLTNTETKPCGRTPLP